MNENLVMPDVRKGVDAEVRRQANVKPHNPNAIVGINATAFMIANFMLVSENVATCTDFLTGWQSTPREINPPNSILFTNGMLEAARVDATVFITEHSPSFRSDDVPDVLKLDITEAVALALTVETMVHSIVAQSENALAAQKSAVARKAKAAPEEVDMLTVDDEGGGSGDVA